MKTPNLKTKFNTVTEHYIIIYQKTKDEEIFKKYIYPDVKNLVKLVVLGGNYHLSKTSTDELIDTIITDLYKYILNYKQGNCYAYFTLCIKHLLYDYLRKSRRHNCLVEYNDDNNDETIWNNSNDELNEALIHFWKSVEISNDTDKQITKTIIKIIENKIGVTSKRNLIDIILADCNLIDKSITRVYIRNFINIQQKKLKNYLNEEF